MNKQDIVLPSFSFLTQEKLMSVEKRQTSLTIGVPREHTFQENRIALCPDSIPQLVHQGYRILIERGAGNLSGFRDEEFSEAGAEIVEDARTVFQANIILKISPPTLAEIDYMKQGSIVISAIHASVQTAEFYRKLMQKKLTCFAYELIKDNMGMFPVLHSMSEITGYTVIQIAAEYLSRSDLGRGVILGNITGISPTEVVIIGAGTVAEFAAKAALGLGATVKIFDNHLYKLRRLKSNLGSHLFTSIIHPKVLQKHLKTADILIGALHSEQGRTPIVVTEAMINEMKRGAIVIDVSIDQGGCIETSTPTTHDNPVFQINGVTHYCVPNIPSRVPRTASFAISNFLTPFLIDFFEAGNLENFLTLNPGFKNGTYIYNGILTNKSIGQTFNIPYQDIELLIAAFIK